MNNHTFSVSIPIQDVQQFIALMRTMRYNFVTDYGREPLGWILGPKEWLMFKMALGEMRGPVYDPPAGLDTKGFLSSWEGLPVHVTAEPGLRFAIEPDMAVRFYRD